MAMEFHLPDIGEGLTEATIVSWYIAVGETVGMDEPLVEIETDKAIVDIPSPIAGVLLHQGAAEGEVLEVEKLLAVVGEEGESWSPGASSDGTPATAADRLESPQAGASGADAAPIVGRIDHATETLGSGSAPKMLPLVRKLAKDLGVDAAGVTGTGPGGRITADDIRESAGRVSPADGSPERGGEVRRVKMTTMRRTIAEHLTRSWREIPHVTTYAEADATSVLAERSALTADGRSVPLEAVLIARLVPLLVEYPEFNAVVDGDVIVHKLHYDVGVAVDTPDGLMVTVVRDASQRDVVGTADEVLRLAAAARNRKATPDELRGATFTLSNIGAVGGRFGTPIVPYGTTAILSIGRADSRPVVRDGEIVVGREFPLSLSYDHRAIDGSTGRAFMAAIVTALETQ